MGVDREGHPVWYDNFNLDFKGLSHHFLLVHCENLSLYVGIHYSVRLEDVLQTCLYRSEKCMKLCEEASVKV